MHMRQHSGFTIIEVMLFLAISALVITATMVGWTTMLNTQSYRDSARSFGSILQQQYTEVTKVANTRSGTLGCRVVRNGGQETTVVAAANQTPIGQANCVIMGRMIEVDGTNITTNMVVGSEPATPLDIGEAEKAILLEYAPARLAPTALEDETATIPWSTRPYRSNGDTATMRQAILIIRSPVSGTVYTYHGPLGDGQKQGNAQALIQSGSQQALQFCLDPGAMVTQTRMAVGIGAFGSSPDAVRVIGNREAQC